MKSAARKTECADEHTERSGDMVTGGNDAPEVPEEQTITFQAIRVEEDREDARDAPEPTDAEKAEDAEDAEDAENAADPEDVAEAQASEDADRPEDEEGPQEADTADDVTEAADPAHPADVADPDELTDVTDAADPDDQPDAADPDDRTDAADAAERADAAEAADTDAPDTDATDADVPGTAPADADAKDQDAADVDAADVDADAADADVAGSDAPGLDEDAPDSPEDVEAAAESPETGERVREVPLPKPVSRALTVALSNLRDSVTGLRLGLDVPGVEEARKAQAELLAQLGNYVIPRVHMSVAPALIVVVGSTGAGKSTLVNTLAAAKVSATGVRRPTTGTPVLACHPDDRDWFAKGDVLGGMIRVDRPGTDSSLETLVLATTERLPEGVALLDTPDIDSVVETHHEIAHRMLDAADLWVFVTTAARYADAPSWNVLRRAKERGARLAIVLSRVPPKSREVIDKHFARMLQEYGLGDVERFVVNESTVTGGRLPEDDVAELRMWLTELSVDEQRREQAVQATLDGVMNSFRARVPALARHLEAQVAFRSELRTDVDAAYMAALAQIDQATTDGSLMRGEVLARWQDFAGSGDLMRTLHLRRPGRLASKASQQGPARSRAFKTALRAALESVIVAAGQHAAEEVVSRWRRHDGVGDRLAGTPGLDGPSEEFVRRVGRMVGAWQEHVVGLVRSVGVAKRSVAKLVAFDEESLALVFMIGLLGYGGSEVAASSGTGTLPERLLRGVLGADALRTIGTKARSDLRARVSVLFDEETLRYVQVLDEAGIPDEAAAKRLYQATYNLEVAR
ncbi:hypothetical protein Skr01_72420 [Sphaerisporangium krabiense]|uniref:Energy-coupling factor transporter ATP-binding protein EcfA2 n=1 Tax=Sphaerisporangium krabiense TaxID=763782 RepID=A0A7W8Z6S4_9ACTN|nr:GTPase [Sphaerisporangium krabiense]MBB5628516.1 energy-coupling factor transporter ATP-binding protein EcfA2 [Sphaerisporangium krabiense]GII67157.1 hypothetical protein Skr01_72420 [Sphaerisporangium krabiense]